MRISFLIARWRPTQLRFSAARAASALLLPPPLQLRLMLLCSQFPDYKVFIINYLALHLKNDTVRLWRILSPICMQSLTTIGCDWK